MALDVASVTSLADATRILHETVVQERAIDSELDRQLSRRSDLERNFLLLTTPTAEARPLASIPASLRTPCRRGDSVVAARKVAVL
jgi:hypothetical protein